MGWHAFTVKHATFSILTAGLDMNVLSPVFLRYLAVGGAGFIIDACFLELLVFREVSVEVARILSMLLATSCTYFLHRAYSFRMRAGRATHKQFFMFLTTQMFAACVNYVAFLSMVYANLFSPDMTNRAAGLIFGTAAGLIVNFMILNNFVFKKRRN